MLHTKWSVHRNHERPGGVCWSCSQNLSFCPTLDPPVKRQQGLFIWSVISFCLCCSLPGDQSAAPLPRNPLFQFSHTSFSSHTSHRNNKRKPWKTLKALKLASIAMKLLSCKERMWSFPRRRARRTIRKTCIAWERCRR